MHPLLLLAMPLLLSAPGPGPRDEAASLPRAALLLDEERSINPCGGPPILLRNDDGSLEDAIGWRYGGVVPPDYGAFAEGYTVEDGSVLCGIEALLLTLSGLYQGQTMDVYVYASDGTNPADVLGLVTGVQITRPGIYPRVTRHDVGVGAIPVPAEFFVGWWGNWPGQSNGWFCTQDLDGPGGKPRTKIAPGLGYPTGWADPSVVWGPTQALGLRIFLLQEAVPAVPASWGAVKSLYSRAPER